MILSYLGTVYISHGAMHIESSAIVLTVQWCVTYETPVSVFCRRYLLPFLGSVYLLLNSFFYLRVHLILFLIDAPSLVGRFKTWICILQSCVTAWYQLSGFPKSYFRDDLHSSSNFSFGFFSYLLSFQFSIPVSGVSSSLFPLNLEKKLILQHPGWPDTASRSNWLVAIDFIIIDTQVFVFLNFSFVFLLPPRSPYFFVFEKLLFVASLNVLGFSSVLLSFLCRWFLHFILFGYLFFYYFVFYYFIVDDAMQWVDASHF